MRAVTFASPVGGETLSWQADDDYVIITFMGSGSAVLSTDPELTWLEASTPSAGGVFEGIRLFAFGVQVPIEILRGEILYVATASGSAALTLYLQTTAEIAKLIQG